MSKFRIETNNKNIEISIENINNLLVEDKKLFIELYHNLLYASGEKLDVLYIEENKPKIKIDNILLNSKNFIFLDLTNPKNIINNLLYNKKSILKKIIMYEILNNTRYEDVEFDIEKLKDKFTLEGYELIIDSIDLEKSIDTLFLMKPIDKNEFISNPEKIYNLIRKYNDYFPEDIILIIDNNYDNIINQKNIYYLIYNINIKYNFICISKELNSFDVEELISSIEYELPNEIPKEKIRTIINDYKYNIFYEKDIGNYNDDVKIVVFLSKKLLNIPRNINFSIEEINNKIIYNFFKNMI